MTDNNVVRLEYAIRAVECVLNKNFNKLDGGINTDPIKFLKNNSFEIEDDFVDLY